MPHSRAPFVTYDSTLLDHVSVGAASAAARTSIRVASVLFLTALTAAAAQVSVHLPFTPVPFTLQPMVVLVGAAALGPRLGAASQVLYLAARHRRHARVCRVADSAAGRRRACSGPTGGYLMAYPIAAFVTGWLAERGFDRRYFTSRWRCSRVSLRFLPAACCGSPTLRRGRRDSRRLACALPSPPASTRSSWPTSSRFASRAGAAERGSGAV